MRGDREYGRFAVEGLIRELQGTKVCVAYQEIIPLLYNQHRALEIIQVDTKIYVEDTVSTNVTALKYSTSANHHNLPCTFSLYVGCIYATGVSFLYKK